jgi:hypothetical protein
MKSDQEKEKGKYPRGFSRAQEKGRMRKGRVSELCG